jgi:hypothetical protein
MSEHHVLVLVDSLDLSVLRAIRYARSLKPHELRAVHMVLDTAHAKSLETKWRANPAANIPLELVNCDDRRLVRGIAELAAEETADGRTDVTLLLPRRNYSALLGRVLHDHTADRIAGAASRLPHVAATIVPFDVAAVIDASHAHRHASAVEEGHDHDLDADLDHDHDLDADLDLDVAHRHDHEHSAVAVGAAALGSDTVATTTEAPAPAPAAVHASGQTPIDELVWRQRAVVTGRVESVTVTSLSGVPAFEIELWDSTGGINVLFYGRRSVGGINPGTHLRVEGRVGEHEGHLAISNPTYQILSVSD